MKLRDATESDLGAIVEIYNAAVATRMATAQLEPVTIAEQLNWFHAHSPQSHPIWVLEEDDAIVGWLSISTFITRCAYCGTAELSVYVRENVRQRGVATRLLGAAIERGPALGLTAFVGLIFAHNEPSLQLFAKFGFARWGFLPGIARLEDVERDLVIMGRRLAVPPNEK